MQISGIYKIQSKIKPERIYIGSAVNISERWRLHLGRLRKNKHHSKKLQRHYDKYGEIDLQFSILLGCQKEDLIKTEQYFLDSYNPYFNCCKVAGSTLGVKYSKDVIKRMSDSKKGRTVWNKGKSNCYSEETRNKISESQKRRLSSPEVRRKMSDAQKGKKHSEESKRKLAIAGKGRLHSEESKCKMSEWRKGIIYTEETKRRISEGHKGQIAWNKGIKTGKGQKGYGVK